jgi:Arc/MetJ family transcription regulator
MRLSVELDEALVRDVMQLTGETKMSAAVAKATEMFANRKKAVAIVRSLREQPLDYGYTNDQIESWGEDSSAEGGSRSSSTSYRVSKDK